MLEFCVKICYNFFTLFESWQNGGKRMSFSQNDYQNILLRFCELSDGKYKSFHEGLVPGVSISYGIRLPELRSIAKEIAKSDAEGFLKLSRSDSYEEILLRGIVIGSMKMPIEEKLKYIEDFLPLIDNWAICDSFCSSFKLKTDSEREVMWKFLLPLFEDEREFYARFAAVMFLDHFIREEYIDEGLKILSSMRQPQYYTQMAVAWAVSVCYVKFPEKTFELIKRKALLDFTQNKSIQKIRESYRVSKEDKDALLKYKL